MRCDAMRPHLIYVSLPRRQERVLAMRKNFMEFRDQVGDLKFRVAHELSSFGLYCGTALNELDAAIRHQDVVRYVRAATDFWAGNPSPCLTLAPAAAGGGGPVPARPKPPVCENGQPSASSLSARVCLWESDERPPSRRPKRGGGGGATGVHRELCANPAVLEHFARKCGVKCILTHPSPSFFSGRVLI